MRSRLTVLVLFLAIALPVFAQTGAMPATVCEIMQHPEQSVGKVVTIRARLWTDHRQFWLSESAAESVRVNAFCGWLPARFSYPTNLVGSTAFASFTGRLIHDSSSPHRVLFLIEGQADIYRQKVLNGPLMIPQLYDKNVHAFVHPEQADPAYSNSLRTSPLLCYLPSLPEGAHEQWFPASETPTVCSYVCNGSAPIRACTKG